MGTSSHHKERKNEVLKNSEIKEVGMYLNEVSKSICKIIVHSFWDLIKGSGFFIKLNHKKIHYSV